MVFGTVISSPRGNLPPEKVLRLAKVYYENACKESDTEVALVLCHDAEVSLSQVKRTVKSHEDQTTREIATLYMGLGELLEKHGYHPEARAFFKKGEKRGGRIQDIHVQEKPPLPAPVDTPVVKSSSVQKYTPLAPIVIPLHIFPSNIRPPTIDFKPPEPDSRIIDTPQLACCLGLLRTPFELGDILDPTAQKWLQVTKNEPDEKERLKTLATDVVRAFKRDELKDSKAVAEVVYLAPVLERDDFRYLIKEFYTGIDQSGLLDVHQLEGLARVIQGADPGALDADDLVKILMLLSTRLQETHGQSVDHRYQLTLAISHVLDAMADARVKGLSREKLHEPLKSYLDKLKGSSDVFLVFQAAYAYQALLCVPDNETLWQATLRRTGKVVQGVSGLVSAVKGLDLNGFVDGLVDIQKGLAGAAEMFQLAKTAFEGASSLAQGGQGFLKSLMEGLSFDRKCAWYAALRGAETLIQEGQLAEFKKLVCGAPCRLDPAFQWGICQLLGNIVANPLWDEGTRKGALFFLTDIYCYDEAWGYHAPVKQWIINIVMHLSTRPEGGTLFSKHLLEQWKTEGGPSKRELYEACRRSDNGIPPLKIALPAMGSPSLLDRVQGRPDVEGNLRQLRRQRLKERGNAVYIPPQAKMEVHARDDTGFPLMEKVDEFLASEQTVFLLLGDSGAGKSTFNRELECHLWEKYKQKSGTIPLHINLPAIDKPEHDMIAKQLRKVEFTEPQIRELKQHRTFILICDGYDESQQTQNLYTSNRLNQPGEWSAKMVITCRSEYVGVDYRDRFQPGDRNHRLESDLFQEAVITPFSLDQVQDYINQYVSIHQPLWEADEYMRALDHIPSLKELVKNPFLMSLSLEVLPRIVDPRHDLSTTQITRVALYDQFIEHWLERGKKRLGEKSLSPQARAAFESLSDEGFTQNGIDYLKRLCKAIYKEQGGQPIVRYSRYKDEGSWKSEFFSREEEKQLLRETCPLIRNGNQHRFIHRSLLEYGVALAIFDPHELKEKGVPESALARRGSTTSVSSAGSHASDDEKMPDLCSDGHEPDYSSPLVWRNFVNEPSVLLFLEERVRQEPQFKAQLLDYIEHSKTHKKWRKAAANSISILIRAGVQFNGADLRNIRIPMADLSHGIFDSAQLQGAEMKRANLRSVWIRQANLTGAKMGGAQFGELPYLSHTSGVLTGVYSLDGKTLAIGLDDGHVIVYSTYRWDNLWTLNGHTASITCLAYSPNGNLLASASEDSTVRIWDVEKGECRFVLQEHTGSVNSIAFSYQGTQLVSTSDDSTAKLWDVESGECRFTLADHTDIVLNAIYSANDRVVATCSEDSLVMLWNPENGECLHVLDGHNNWVKAIDFSWQGDIIASAGSDTVIHLWDAHAGDWKVTLVGHNSCIDSIKFSHKGPQLISSSRDKTVRLWDAEIGTCIHVLSGHSDLIRKAVFSHQDDLIASSSDDKAVRIWDAETGMCYQTLTGHAKDVQGAVFSPKGGQVASFSKDMTVRLWDVATRRSQHISRGHIAGIWKLRCSPNGHLVATTSKDTTARLWDVRTGTCRHILRGHIMESYGIAYSPNGDKIATSGFDNTVRVWDIETGVCTRVLDGHEGEVNLISYSPQGNRLASPSDDGTVRLWDVNSGECLFILTGHGEAVSAVDYSPDGSRLASSSWDSTCRLWDPETGACLQILAGHEQKVWRLHYSPDGTQIASCSDDNTVRLWDATSGECQHIISGLNERVYTISYSPNGRQVASTAKNGAVQIWDTATGSCLWTLEGHTEEVNRILYSPQGDVVVSAGDDKTVRLWDAASGQCRGVIQDLQDDVKDIDWVQISGVDHLVTGCQDGAVRMWKLINDGDQYRVRLRWSSMNNGLAVSDAIIQDAQGLSELNKHLLKQRGTVGEPFNPFRNATKRLTSLATTLSKFRMSARAATATDAPIVASPIVEESTEELEKDPVQEPEKDPVQEPEKDSVQIEAK